MKKNAVLSRLIYLGVVLCLLVSFVVAGCSQAPAPSAGSETTSNETTSKSSEPKAVSGESASKPAEAKPVSDQQSGPKSGGTMKVSNLADGVAIGYPPKMLPTSQIQALPAIETLFRNDKTGKPVPWLVDSYTTDATAKTITLVLKKGIKFHDGTDFDAEAVKSVLDLYMSVKTPGTEKFKSIDVVDGSTVRINLSDWDSTVISALTQYAGMMISPTAYKKNGEDWVVNHPVGTGPFEFVGWEKDARTVYKKFDGYWQKGKPYLDSIEFTPIPDPLTRQLALKKGEIDVALRLPVKDLAGLEKEGLIVSRMRQGSGAWGLVPDSVNSSSPWANLKVRQAAQHALDTEAIVKAVFGGENEATNQWIYKGHWGYNPSVVGYPYDPAKAKQLLAEAGYGNGFKTKLTFLTNPESEQLMTAVQSYFKEVGIDAQLEPINLARWQQLAIQGNKWEGLLSSGPFAGPDAASGLIARMAGGGKTYAQMIVPDDYVKAIKDAISAPDFETKQKNVQEALRLMVDKYAMQIILYAGSDDAVSSKKVHDHGFYATPDSTAWTPENAWLDR